MKFRKLLIVVLLSCFVVSLNAYDSLVENEPYFQKAIEKSKLNGFGKDMVIAVLDTGINDNDELHGKVIAEYDFTTNSDKAIDNDGHGTKLALDITYNKYVENYKSGVYNVV